MKIAIIHEMLIKLGGAEKVLQVLMQIYPDADIFTLMYDEKKVGADFPKNRIHCDTPAQTLFSFTGKPRLSLPLMPASVRKINLAGYELVISSSSGFAHGVCVDEKTKHICYCHSPARYLWDATDEIQREIGVKIDTDKKNTPLDTIKSVLGGPIVTHLFDYLRKIDIEASKRPTIYIANSHEVQTRIQQYYQRDSVILWPPIETSRFSPGPIPVSKRLYYVITSALTPFKKVDRVIRVMTKLGVSIKIIGDGAQRQELQKIAGANVQFLGRISDEEKVKIYMNARGFLMPQKEDAGIAPIEAMAAGIPVFGLAKGGLLEVNIDGVTGRFFPEETDESFERGFVSFDQEVTAGRYDNSDSLIGQAKKFDVSHFREEFQRIIDGEMNG